MMTAFHQGRKVGRPLARLVIGTAAALLSLVVVPLPGLAQTTQTRGTLKQLGVTSDTTSETVPSLIVLNAHGVTLQGSTLTLLGVASNAIICADRPVRSAGHALTAHLLEEATASRKTPRTRRCPRSAKPVR